MGSKLWCAGKYLTTTSLWSVYIYTLNIQKTKIMASRPITSWQIDGETTETETLFCGAPKSLQMVTAAMNLKDTHPLEEKQCQTLTAY